MNNWKKEKVGEIGYERDGTRKKSWTLSQVCSFIDYRGKTPPKTTSGVPLITAKIIKNGAILVPQEFIAKDYYNSWMRRGIPQLGDVIFTTEAPLGEVALLKTSKKVAFAQRVIILHPDKVNLDNKYLFYALQDRILKHRIQSRANGTTVLGIKSSELKKVIIDLPPLHEQKAIASVLSALDDKIELNNRINENLEQQAQAIFKSWFVDFEPFQNGEFVDSELGRIPKGWNICKLSDFCDSISIKHDFNRNQLIFLNTGDIANGEFLHKNYMDIRNMPGQAKKSIRFGDILYSEIRPINRHFAFVSFDSKDYVVSTKLMVIHPHGISGRRLYHYLTTDAVISELQLEAESRSGTFPQIRFENIQNLAILIATSDIESQFSTFLMRMYETIDSNRKENSALKQLRDALLPKLMSGEIRVPTEGG